MMMKIWNVVKKVLGVYCLLMVLGGVIATVQEKEPGLLALAAVFGLLAWLCFRRPKKKKQPEVIHTTEVNTPLVTVTTERTAPEVPEEILKQMRRSYGPMQAQNDARILAESFHLCQHTFDFDTFFSRMKLAQQKANTLLQAKQARCKGIIEGTEETCTHVLSTMDDLQIDFLERKYEKETQAAMKLKTPAGQKKRLEAFLNELQFYETEFISVEDVYNDVVEKVKMLIKE